MTAVVAHFILPYDWSWPQSLLFGAIVAATDPVAAVALLKEVGSSPQCQQFFYHQPLPSCSLQMMDSLTYQTRRPDDLKSGHYTVGTPLVCCEHVQVVVCSHPAYGFAECSAHACCAVHR